MKVKVLIIGGDEKVIELIDAMKEMTGIELSGVCDVTEDSVGMNYAKKTGINTYTDLAQSVAIENLNLIIEMSGSKHFQSVLNQIADKDVKIVDIEAAQILLNLAAEKTKLQKHEQLQLADELSGIFSSEYDTFNIALPIFNLLSGSFKIDVQAMLIFDSPKDELIIISKFEIDNAIVKQILKFINESAEIESQLIEENIEVSVINVPGKEKISLKMNSKVIVPLLTKTGKEGVLIFTGSQKDIFSFNDRYLLNILSHEFARFIEHERIKKDLTDAKNKLQAMLKSMTEGVIAVNNKNEVMLINSAAIDLFEIENNVSGNNIENISDEESVSEMLKDAVLQNAVFVREVKLGLGEKPKILKFFAAPINDNLGRILGKVLLIADVTKEAEIDRMKSEFISTTSHELRTPLTAIKEALAIILDGVAGDVSVDQKRFLGLAKRNVERLARLINDMLDLSKIETGRMKLNKKMCSVYGLLDDVVSQLDLVAKDKDVSIVKECEEGIPEVECDPDRVTQIIINLMGNAIKFTPQGGKITVACRLPAPSAVEGSLVASEKQDTGRNLVEISVKDTGPGIEKKDFAKLFQRFEQLDGSLTRKVGGTGLGLCISKELVELHGGRIWVESEEGEGCTFIFTLPV